MGQGILTFTVGVLLVVAQAANSPVPLTEDGLRAWLQSGGVFEANRKLIHDQFEQQRTQLPPWWPKSVWDQEEAATQSVDMVKVALPFYQPCITEPEVRILVKLGATQVGKKVLSTALITHVSDMVAGSTSMEAQLDGESAAAATVKGLSAHEKADTMAALTPQDQSFIADHFSPDRVVKLKQCTDHAYAEMSAVIARQQEAAVEGVVNNNREQLTAAHAAWVKEHPTNPNPGPQ